MAVSVMYGNTADVNALIYPTPHQNTIGFLQQQMDDASQRVVGAGKQFFERARSLFDKFSSEDAIRKAKAAKRAATSLWDTEEVKYLASIEEFQNANNTMRRWVMANPVVRGMFQKQKLEGYDGLYRDPFPEDKHEEHYDYRRVMNGVVVDTVDENGEDSWTATTYIDDLMPDDHELDPIEQGEILDSWAAIETLLKRRQEDPTSKWGADLP